MCPGAGVQWYGVWQVLQGLLGYDVNDDERPDVRRYLAALMGMMRDIGRDGVTFADLRQQVDGDRPRPAVTRRGS